MTASGWWYTLSAMSRLGKAVYGHNDLLTRQWMNEHPEHFATYARILQYTRLSAITSSWFTTLRGYPPAVKERRNALLLGVMTPLYDDLMDEQGMSHVQILSSQANSNPSLRTVRNILDELNETVTDKNIFARVLAQSGAAQDHSLRQMELIPLSVEELVEITTEKGAAFTLIYRVILDHTITSDEEEAIHTLGLLLQLTNDLFDVHKDLENGQQTLLTREDDLDNIRNLWEQYLLRFRMQWQSLPYSTKAIRQSLFQIAILLGRGQVALDRLIQLTATTDGHFHPATYTRQQLICDMEKPSNLWASLVWAKNWCTQNIPV
ncbi:MAG: class 1 isoprenoid biosynthesis enzyme [Saprospiraceae bacterium]|nr:class 1 isoprenoid biosynthesis enzyme [Saprospiraceae bacterium]